MLTYKYLKTILRGSPTTYLAWRWLWWGSRYRRGRGPPPSPTPCGRSRTPPRARHRCGYRGPPFRAAVCHTGFRDHINLKTHFLKGRWKCANEDNFKSIFFKYKNIRSSSWRAGIRIRTNKKWILRRPKRAGSGPCIYKNLTIFAHKLVNWIPISNKSHVNCHFKANFANTSSVKREGIVWNRGTMH